MTKEKRLNLRKIDISAPIPIENSTASTSIKPTNRTEVLTERNISSMKIEMQPVKKQKSNLATKGNVTEAAPTFNFRLSNPAFNCLFDYNLYLYQT